MANIHDEIAAFKSMQSQLEADHSGEWVLMRDGEIIGLFASFGDAAAEGLRLYGRTSYLVRQVGAEPMRLPVSVIHHRHAR